MENYKPLNFEEQIDLFIKRGMPAPNKNRNISKLKYINYYKLKELAYPFYDKESKKYININFDDLLTRYYQDKHIRLAVLSCIEKIEIAFKTQFCHLLGSKHGAFGYLQFSNWCNKNEFCKHYISEKQGNFKKRIKENFYIYSKKKCIQELDNQEKIPIWMLVEVLTFGEVLYLFGLMSTENQKKIALNFNCKANELLSWLKSLKFIRNQCAHNSNIIDIKMQTKPTLRDEWRKFLLVNNKNQTSGCIADVIMPMVFLTVTINPKYAFNDLQKSINSLTTNNNKAKMLGFKDTENSKKAIKKLGGNFKNLKKK